VQGFGQNKKEYIVEAVPGAAGLAPAVAAGDGVIVGVVRWKISTTAEAFPVVTLFTTPPPKRAKSPTEVAPRAERATERVAVVQVPLAELKISTSAEKSLFTCPPPKRANFPTEVAARLTKATGRVVVVQVPLVELKISTTASESSEFPIPPPKRAKSPTEVAARSKRA